MAYQFNHFLAAAAAAIGVISTVASANEKASAAGRAAAAQSDALGQAINETETARYKALKFQEPYVKTGKDQLDFFDKYNNDPQFKYSMYTEYAKTGDPLYDFYQQKQDKALNRQLAARGKYDSGAGIRALGEQNATLSANMANLTDTRVARELSTRLSLLGTGKQASDISSQIEMQSGNQISNFMVGRGQAIAAGEKAKGDAFGGMWDTFAGMGFGAANSILEFGTSAGGGGMFGGGGGVPGSSGVGPGGVPIVGDQGSRGTGIIPKTMGEVYGPFPAPQPIPVGGNGGGGGMPPVPTMSMPSVSTTSNGMYIEQVPGQNTGSPTARGYLTKNTYQGSW